MIYPNFFSFLRDTMKRSANRHMTLTEIEFHTEKWEQEPVSALNVWFTLMLSWSKVISSMLKFLIGELPSMPIKAPMLEHNEDSKTWGWIGMYLGLYPPKKQKKTKTKTKTKRLCLCVVFKKKKHTHFGFPEWWFHFENIDVMIKPWLFKGKTTKGSHN